jgi:hypothetical protein
MSTLEDVTKSLMFLSAVWPKFPLSAATIKAYHTVLGDLPADALASAAEQLGADSTFFPVASELRKLAFDLSQGDDLPLAVEGWKQILDRWGGRYVEFFPLTERTVKVMGGIRLLGQTTDRETPFVRNQFISIFDTYRARAKEDRRLLPSVKEYKKLQAGKIDEHIRMLTDDLRGK